MLQDSVQLHLRCRAVDLVGPLGSGSVKERHIRFDKSFYLLHWLVFAADLPGLLSRAAVLTMTC